MDMMQAIMVIRTTKYNFGRPEIALINFVGYLETELSLLF
jgi:hypothetical protein